MSSSEGNFNWSPLVAPGGPWSLIEARTPLAPWGTSATIGGPWAHMGGNGRRQTCHRTRMSGDRGPHQPPPLCARVRPGAPIEARTPWHLGEPSGTDGRSWAHMGGDGRRQTCHRMRMSGDRGPRQPPPLCARVRPCAPIEARTPWHLGEPSGNDGRSWERSGGPGAAAPGKEAGVRGRQPLGKKLC